MALSGSVSTNVIGDDNHIGLKLSWTATQSVANNQSTISWTLATYEGYTGNYWKAGPITVTIAGTTVLSITDRITIYGAGAWSKSGTIALTHNSDGTKSFAVSISAAIYSYSVNCTASQTFTLDTIPRSSSFTVSNGTLGTAQTITVTKANSSFTHTMSYECGTATGTICTKSSSTSISFTPPLTLASQNTTGTSVSVKIRLQTYSGSTAIGSTVVRTVSMSIPSSVKPTCGISYTDATGLFDTYSGMIQSCSKLNVTVDTTTAYGAEIASYKTVVDGSTYTASSFTTTPLTTSGTLTISTTVTDTRGRSGTSSTTVKVLEYTPPQISKLHVTRCDEDGTSNPQGEYSIVTFSYTASSLNSLNNCSSTIRYKKSSTTAYTNADTGLSNVFSVTNSTYIFPADSGSSYDVILLVEDDITSSSKNTAVSTGFTIIHVSADGKSIAFGKVSEKSRAMEIGFDHLYDKYGTEMTNGVALHGETLDDTLEHVVSAPSADIEDAGYYHIVNTFFFNGKDSGLGKVQLALPYRNGNYIDMLRYRCYFNDTSWSNWVKIPTITEEGTDGNWTYRKWTNGTVDLWGSFELSNIACTTALGTWYRTTVKSIDAFPFTVYSPNVQLSYESAGNGTLIWTTTESTSTKPPNFYLIRPTSLSSFSGTIYAQVIGKWRT